jgi:DNA adenine methylase
MVPYIGGKNYLANFLISNFQTDYVTRTYCEVFGGGGWVLFKKQPSFLEVYNDLNSDLTNLFRVIRDNYPEFEHRAQWTLHSREMYAEAMKRLQEDKFLSDTEKAMFYAIRRMQTFSGGNTNSWAYAVTAKKVESGKWLPFLKRLDLINARLKRVQIECLDFERIIRKYDGKNTFFYLDPPYVEKEFYYKTKDVNFTIDDHQRLARLLKGIQGKFMLSYYEHPLVRELYGKYRIVEKSGAKHSCGATLANREGFSKPKSEELVIMNY